MRSSKSRSRSKQNRPRTLGNIVNRVFDSSGPEGKVRGTPQQIIEKYLLLARDAQLGNDRVASENFLQHAEHYIRMLAEAQRELAREQEQRSTQQGQGNGNGDWQPRERRERDRDGSEVPFAEADAAEVADQEDSSLVETPENRAPRRDERQSRDERPPREDRQPREDRRDRGEDRHTAPREQKRAARVLPDDGVAMAPAAEATASEGPVEAPADAVDGEAGAPRARRPRGPRRPKKVEADTPTDDSPASAAE